MVLLADCNAAMARHAADRFQCASADIIACSVGIATYTGEHTLATLLERRPGPLRE